MFHWQICKAADVPALKCQLTTTHHLFLAAPSILVLWKVKDVYNLDMLQCDEIYMLYLYIMRAYLIIYMVNEHSG